MFRFSLFILLGVVSLVACTANTLHIGAKNKLQHLSFVALAEANQHTSTAVDVLFIYDTNVIHALPKTGAAWFAEKGVLMNQYGQHMDIAAFEIVPLSQINESALPKNHSSAVAILIYAHMLREQPVISLPTEEKCVKMTLAEQSIKYENCH